MNNIFVFCGILLFTLQQASSCQSAAPALCTSNDTLNWIFYKGNCYTSVPASKNYLYFDPAIGVQIDRAIQICFSYDAQLPTLLTSSSQVADIAKLLAINASSHFFVDAFATTYLNFKWSSKQNVDTSQNLFLPDQPNNHYGTSKFLFQGCVRAETNDVNGEWGLNDVPCDYTPIYQLPDTLVCQRCSNTPQNVSFNVVLTTTGLFNKTDLKPTSGFFNATSAATERTITVNEFLKRVISILNNPAVSIYNSSGTEKDTVTYDNGEPSSIVTGAVPISTLTYSTHISSISRHRVITRNWIVHTSDCDVPNVVAAFNAAIMSTIKDTNFIPYTGHFVSGNVVANVVY